MVDILKKIASVFSDGIIDDAVKLLFGVETYDAWDTVSITRSIEQIAGTFSVSMADKWRYSKDTWPFKPGNPVSLFIEANQIITGYTDKINVSIASDDRKLTISGRDKTGDLVDSSANALYSEFKNITIDQLARAFCSDFGILVKMEVSPGLPFPKFTVKQGETVFELLNRAAQLRGLLLTSDETGDLVITNRAAIISKLPSIANPVKLWDFVAPTVLKSNIPLLQGENILSGSASYDYSERFSTYTVKGQMAGSDEYWGAAVTSPEGKAFDPEITRPRQCLIITESSTDFTAAKSRAEWEASIRAAKSLSVSVKVQGWKKPGGGLWKPNEVVRIQAGFLGIDADLLITSVTFTKSIEDGTLTEIKLTRPDSYNPKPIVEANEEVSKFGW